MDAFNFFPLSRKNYKKDGLFTRYLSVQRHTRFFVVFYIILASFCACFFVRHGSVIVSQLGEPLSFLALIVSYVQTGSPCGHYILLNKIILSAF